MNFVYGNEGYPQRDNFCEVREKLRKLVERTGYIINQCYGQRVYRNSIYVTESPKDCEVYVGDLPRDMFEDELVPLFELIGKILELRLMVEFSGKSRGFCFVKYFNEAAAREAVRKLDGFVVRSNRRITVQKSVNNCRLFVGGLPLYVAKEEIQKTVENVVEGLKNVIMYPSKYVARCNRGYGFLEFHNHRAAAKAYRQLGSGSFKIWGVSLKIDWADPIPEVDPNIMAKITRLYLRNLDVNLTKDQLWHTLNLILPPPNGIVKVHKTNNFAFVHFSVRPLAEKAMKLITEIFGNTIEVSWARPQEFNKENRMKTMPTHRCLSVPSRIRKNISKSKHHNCN